MYKNNKVLVIIPARSGSKGIKNKNIKILKKKPLISYTIKYAKNSNFVDQIVVTTDSTKYAKIAKKFGASVPFLRSKKLAGGKVKDYPVIKDCLKNSEFFFKTKFNYIILLRPTSPFREKDLIKKGINILHKNKSASSIRSVIKTKYHPYRHWKLNKKGRISSIIKNIHEPYNIPRQQLPNFFFQSGDIEIIKRKTLMKGSVSGNYILPLIVKTYSDLDTIDDFKKLK